MRSHRVRPDGAQGGAAKAALANVLIRDTAFGQSGISDSTVLVSDLGSAYLREVQPRLTCVLAERHVLYELRYAARQRLTADLFIGALLGPMGLRVFSTCPVVNLAIRKG